jgi:hypothetical protein
MLQIDNLYFISTRNVRGKQARMLVPKMVKNGFNSVPRVRVTSRRLDFEWESGTGANTKRGIKTIFNQFRSTHAR